ncbi:MAG: hypothetical protein WC763_06115 [Candidatus Paceibacterota bacterium]
MRQILPAIFIAFVCSCGPSVELAAEHVAELFDLSEGNIECSKSGTDFRCRHHMSGRTFFCSGTSRGCTGEIIGCIETTVNHQMGVR